MTKANDKIPESETILAEIAANAEKVEALQKIVADKALRLEDCRVRLVSVAEEIGRLAARRTAALADGADVKGIDEKIEDVAAARRTYADTVAACQTVINGSRAEIQKILSGKQELDQRLAAARLTERLTEYNTATFNYSELLNELVPLAAAAGWNGFRNALPEYLYQYRAGEPLLCCWQLSHGLIRS